MTELYKNSIVADIQCQYAELINILALKLKKAEPCLRLVTDATVVSTLLKRLRYYNGLDFTVYDSNTINIVRTDTDEITITITLLPENISFTYVGTGDSLTIKQYFYSKFKNYFNTNSTNYDVLLVDQDLIFISITEGITLNIDTDLVSATPDHTNTIEVIDDIEDPTCIFLDEINCLTYSEFCSLYNKVKEILAKYNCNCQ